MDKRPKISVILPVYNVEKYLDRCLKTIVEQTLEEIEIIIIDDGSTDNCPKLCDEWSKKDNRIKVIHKKNEGLGIARNTGIENATGKYVCFFDSDDYVKLDTLEKAYEKIEKERADVCYFGFEKISRTGETIKKIVPNTPKIIYEDKDVQDEFLINLISKNSAKDMNLWMSAWDSIFSLDLIKKINWKFVSEREIISEDIYSLLYLYKYVRKVVIIKESLYCYCTNANSLTHTYRKDRFEKIKRFYNSCILACKELNYGNEVIERIKYPFLANTIGALKILVMTNNTIKEKFTELKKIISDDLVQKIVRDLNIKEETIARKILFEMIKHKMYCFCYIIIFIKVRSKKE